jgi:hypothetical protein
MLRPAHLLGDVFLPDKAVPAVRRLSSIDPICFLGRRKRNSGRIHAWEVKSHGVCELEMRRPEMKCNAVASGPEASTKTRISEKERDSGRWRG